VRRIAAALLVSAAVAACGVGAGRGAPVTFPPQSFGAAGSPTPAILQARSAVTAALGAAGIIVDEPQSPFRPAETPRVTAAPRSVIRAVLPRDPERGLISIYGFMDPSAAARAGQEQAAYIASPVGRVQFPTGTQFTIRQFGSALIFFSEVPGSSPDPQAVDVAEALRTVGSEVVVPG
jgi:hypothetical protein